MSKPAIGISILAVPNAAGLLSLRAVMRLLVALLLCGEAAARARTIPDGEFVRVEGTHFVSGTRPFVFVGANAELLHGLLNRQRYETTLDALAADGLTVARIWALGEGATDASPEVVRSDLFRVGPDGFVEAAYQQLDRVMAAARVRNIRLIITLANYWGDYGGIPAYLAWAGLPDRGFGARDRFFSDERTRAFYRAHLDRLLQRTNTVTGVRYRDDPTIFAWELFNELRVDTEEGDRARLGFIGEMARFIKARDPNHLVSPGLLGYTNLAERAQWIAAQRLPEVDYCDSHLYPETTDQVASEGGGDALSALARLRDFIDDRVQLAHYVLGKPIVFGEFGFQTTHDRWLGQPRSRWFARFLDRIAYDGAAGALAWIYQPWPSNGRPRDFGIYVDRHDTDDVRAVLRVRAGRSRKEIPQPQNPRLGSKVGERPLYDPYRRVQRPPRYRVHRDADGTFIDLPPEAFTAARWERLGTWEGGELVHTYGSNSGFFEWRFIAPAATARPACLRFSARLSSEYPGTEAPPNGTSRVTVLLDGIPIGTREVAPDDGRGKVEEIEVTDPERLRHFGGRPHTLRFAVEPGPFAHGLCVYGAPTKGSQFPREETTPVRIHLESAPISRAP